MSAIQPYGSLPSELPDLLIEIAVPTVPDYTDDVLAITGGTRQRPRWTFLERWLPMIITRQRLAIPPIPWRALGVAAAILLLLALTLFAIGSQHRTPAPFGLARNGAIVYDAGGDIFILDSIDGKARPLVSGPGNDLAPGFTRSGDRVNFLRLTAEATASSPDLLDLFVANADGSTPVDVSGPLVAPNWFDIAPDDSIAVVHAVDPATPAHLTDDARSKLYVLDLRHPAAPRQIDLPVQWATVPSFRGPDGAEIVFRAAILEKGHVRVGVFAARPDGTGFRPLTPTDGTADAYQQPQVSPDGRLLTYTTWNRPISSLQIHIRDLATGNDRIITPRGYHQGYATFSPDGMRISFVEYSADRDQIMLQSLAPGSVCEWP